MWAPITAELVREVAYDTDHFTSRAVVVSTSIIEAERPIGAAPPITSDPPFHALARRLLLPPFVPKQIEPWEPEIRKLCRERLDDMGPITAGETVVDAAQQYAQHIPVNVIARMLGFPLEDDDLFREFVHDALEGVNRAPEVRQAGFEKLDNYIDAQIEAHRVEPATTSRRTSSMSSSAAQKLSQEHVRGSIVLLLIAGIDTTWSAIGSSLWHLASHPEDRRRLVAEPELMPTAIEELLRAYAPVTMARMVAEDHDFHGCPMKDDEWVLLPFPAANRDPALFDRADEVVIDRLENRHAAFGLGIHRCLGSNLARLELRVAVEEFLAPLPRVRAGRPERRQVERRPDPRPARAARAHPRLTRRVRPAGRVRRAGRAVTTYSTAHPLLTDASHTVAMVSRGVATMHRLLVAEDDRAVRESLSRALELEGYVVTAVGNGAEAIDAVASGAPGRRRARRVDAHRRRTHRLQGAARRRQPVAHPDADGADRDPRSRRRARRRCRRLPPQAVRARRAARPASGAAAARPGRRRRRGRAPRRPPPRSSGPSRLAR